MKPMETPRPTASKELGAHSARRCLPASRYPNPDQYLASTAVSDMADQYVLRYRSGSVVIGASGQ